MFCVFSGQGVLGLRRYLNSERDFAELRGPLPGEAHHQQGHPVFAVTANAEPAAHAQTLADGAFDDGEPDVVDDDDGLEDGSEMAIDTIPLMGPLHSLGTDGQASAVPPIPPPPPQPSFLSGSVYQHTALSGDLPDGSSNVIPPRVLGFDEEEDGNEAMDLAPAGLSSSTASTAAFNPSHDFRVNTSLSRSRQASGASPVPVEHGASTASVPGPMPGPSTSSGTSRATAHEDLGQNNADSKGFA